MQRDWESCGRTWKRRTWEATPIRLVDESKEGCTGARRTETCGAPRHSCRYVTWCPLWPSTVMVIFVVRVMRFYFVLVAYFACDNFNTHTSHQKWRWENRGAHQVVQMAITEKTAPTTGTAWRTTGHVPVDSRQWTPSICNCVTR